MRWMASTSLPAFPTIITVPLSQFIYILHPVIFPPDATRSVISMDPKMSHDHEDTILMGVPPAEYPGYR
jgi:hypothetical protein